MAQHQRKDFEVSIATVQGGGALLGAFEKAELPLILGERRFGGGWDRATQRRLQRAASRADIVHTHLFAGHIWGRWAARRAQGPKILSTLHNIDRDEAWHHRLARRATRQWADHTVCVSEAVAAHALENRWASEEHCTVIPNGIDLSRFHPKHTQPEQARALLAIGRLVPQKGFDLLLSACASLDVHLKIVGDGPDLEQLKRTAPANAEFMGTRDDIPTQLSSADLLVIPSRWEGFGLVAAEAMAAGVPVVATAVDGLVEVLGPEVANVQPNDVAALRNAIRSMCADPKRRTEQATQAQRRVRDQFDLARTVEAYSDRYRQLTADDRALE
jgi:glycosyltransferase involved in cell wall biosynthesis